MADAVVRSIDLWHIHFETSRDLIKEDDLPAALSVEGKRDQGAAMPGQDHFTSPLSFMDPIICHIMYLPWAHGWPFFNLLDLVTFAWRLYLLCKHLTHSTPTCIPRKGLQCSRSHFCLCIQRRPQCVPCKVEDTEHICIELSASENLHISGSAC